MDRGVRPLKNIADLYDQPTRVGWPDNARQHLLCQQQLC